VPLEWLSLLGDIGTGKCWFPLTKYDHTKIHFYPTQITKMIIESYVPNDRDDVFYDIQKVAGPFSELFHCCYL